MIPGNLDTWKLVAGPGGHELREAAAEVSAGDLQAISILRKKWSADEVAVALDLARARRSAAKKFPDSPGIISDLQGIAQATPAIIAGAKACRFKDVLGRDARVLDLGCGIGGDAMALAAALDVIGIDLDPIRCWMTGENAGCATIVDDVRTVELEATAFHLDPSRRDPLTGRRLQDPSTWHPPLESMNTLRSRIPDGVVKLGPGIAIDTIPDLESCELEFVSLGGSLSQAHLWQGRLALEPGRHRATMWPGEHSITGMPAFPELREDGSLDAFLAVPDPALERAGLHGIVGREWNLAEPVAGLGLMTGPDRPGTEWFTMFGIEHSMPWRPQQVKAWLRDNDAGHVEIKTRDQAVNPDEYQASFSGNGSTPWTIFVLRMGRPVVAVMTRRVEQ